MATAPKTWATILTKEVLDIELAAGHFPKQIATTFGCSENTVRGQMARYGLGKRSVAPKGVARDYAKLGSISSLADKHGVSTAKARRWLLDAGIELNRQSRPVTTGFDIAVLASRYEKGESLTALSESSGITLNTLYRNLKAHGAAIRPRGRPTGSQSPA